MPVRVTHMPLPPQTDSPTRRPLGWRPGLLVALFVVTAAVSALSKSTTYDEQTNLGIGTRLALTRSWSAHYAWHHPPLSFYLSALPDALPCRLLARLEQVTRARLAMLFTALALAVLVYAWATELYGPRAGLVALALTSFSPNLLAHMPLVTPDGTLTCTVFAAAYAVWRYGCRPGIGRACVAGLAIGLSLLAKFPSLLFLPLWALAAAVGGRGLRRRTVAVHIITAAFIAWLLLNAGYAFSGFGKSLDADSLRSAPVKRCAGNPIAAAAFRALPKPFLEGIDFQLAHAAEGEWGFLMGEHSKRGWPHYFLVAFLIKTPVALQALLLATVILAYRRASNAAGSWSITAICLALPAALLFAWMSLLNPIDIGFRYVLPVLPFVHVAVSRLAALRWPRPRVVAALIAAGVIAHAGESAAAFPHYIAFFNAWIGGPANGYRYLIDSNLDWGQDAHLARRYMVESSSRVIFKPGNRFVHGRVLVNANALQGMSPEEARVYAWLRPFKPVGYLGYSYLVYDVPAEAVPRNELGARGYAHLGRLLYAGQQPRRAVKEFRSAIECAPREVEGYIGLAKCFAAMKDKPRARRVLRDALALMGQDAQKRGCLEELLRAFSVQQGDGQ